jgi:hypothetical protein
MAYVGLRHGYLFGLPHLAQMRRMDSVDVGVSPKSGAGSIRYLLIAHDEVGRNAVDPTLLKFGQKCLND